MATITTDTRTISGLRDYYQRLTKREKQELRTRLNNPAPATLNRWLNDPAMIRLEEIEIIMSFLLKIYPDVTTKKLMELR